TRRRELTAQKAQLARQRETADKSLLALELQAEVAAWEKEVAGAARTWQVLEPVEFKSEQGATLTKLADGSLLSGGKRPEKDTYTVVVHTSLKGITAVRLEVLTDDSLPRKGPGRQDNGNLHLNEFAVVAAPRSDTAAGQPLAWKSAR